MNADETIARYLLIDILLASAHDELPPPPKVPTFAAITVRPGKVQS